MGSRKNKEAIKENKIDLDSYCRTCALKNSPSTSIFSYGISSSITSSFASIIEKYLPIKVSESDELPMKLCAKCADTLLAFEQLAEQVVEAESALQEIAASLKQEQHKTQLDYSFNEDGVPSDDDIPLNSKYCKQKKGRVKEESDEKEEKLRCKPRLASRDHNSSSKRLSCLLCLKSVKALDIHKHHFKHAVIDNTDIIHCPVCGESLSIHSFCGHLAIHFDVKWPVESTEHGTLAFPHQCYICEEESLNRFELLSHAARHLNVTKTYNTLHCFVCGKIIQYISLRRHLAVHETRNRFECPVCGKKYAQESGMVRHHEVHHEGCAKHKCPICFEVLPTHAKLLKHQKTHLDPKPFQCDSCGDTFYLKKQLYHHQKYHHTENGLRVTCTQCDKVFSSRSVLYRHEKTVHLHLKDFQCEICSNQFTTKQYLKEHLKKHAGDRSEVCDICGKGFQVSQNLRQHMKIHKDRAFQCDTCERRFTRKYQLIYHMRRHPEVLPYSCQNCGKTFVLRLDFVKHSESHANCSVSDLGKGVSSSWDSEAVFEDLCEEAKV